MNWITFGIIGGIIIALIVIFIVESRKDSSDDVPKPPKPPVPPKPVPPPEPAPTKPIYHFTHGFLYPGDANEFYSAYVDIFVKCKVRDVMMMAVNWPAHTMNCDTIYKVCVEKGIGFWPSPIDLGYVKGTIGIEGWANQVIDSIPQIVSLYPEMKGWFLGADLTVTSNQETPSICGIATGSTGAKDIITSVTNAMLSAKNVPIAFETFAGGLGNYRLDEIYESFFSGISTREKLIANFYIDSWPWVRNNAEEILRVKEDLPLYINACRRLGMKPGTMINYVIPGIPPKYDWNLTLRILNDLSDLYGELRVYPDQLLNFKAIAFDYMRYLGV